jgi:hypothetical protein
MNRLFFARGAMLTLVTLALLTGGARANQVAPSSVTGETLRGDAAWGIYDDLVGKTWLIVDKSAFNSFYIVRFRREQDQLVGDNTLYTVAGESAMELHSRSVIHRLPDGRLQGEDKKTFGVVASDGSIVFSTRSAFGREKVVSTIRRVDGQVVGVFAAEPKRPFVYNKITDDEIPDLVAQWNERRESRNRERAAARQARWDQFNAVLEGVTATLSEIQNVTHAQALASGSRLSPAAAPATAGNAGTTSPAAARQAPGQPLRFVLDISLANKPGDAVNPTCYSNVITRSGPSGWGAAGTMPPASMGQAKATVESFKARFIAACRRSGRDITSEGDFHWTWNETPGAEDALAGTGPRYPEDVLVSVD